MKALILKWFETAMFAVGLPLFGLGAYIRYEQGKMILAFGCLSFALFCIFELSIRIRSNATAQH
jgi:hypothetical protein